MTGLSLSPRASGRLAELIRRGREAPPEDSGRDNTALYQPGDVIRHVYTLDQTLYGPYQLGYWAEFDPAAGDAFEFGDICWVKPPGGTPLPPGAAYPAVRRGEWFEGSYLVFAVIGGGGGGLAPLNGCHLRRTTDFAINSPFGFVVIPLQDEPWDTHNYWDVSDPDYIRLPSAGHYMASFNCVIWNQTAVPVDVFMKLGSPQHQMTSTPVYRRLPAGASAPFSRMELCFYCLAGETFSLAARGGAPGPCFIQGYIEVQFLKLPVT